MSALRFLSCDWGTSSFRLRLVEDQRVLAEIERPEGVREIHARLVAVGRSMDVAARHDAFAGVVRSALTDLAAKVPDGLRGEAMVISGMASANVGWRELPYANTPTPVDGTGFHLEAMEPLENGGAPHAVWMISGLSTGADMMRGEECEVCGLLASPAMERFRSDCMLVLPGTHSKHVRVRNGFITGFRTHLTGELLELLSTRSLLAVSVDWPPPVVPDHGAVADTPWAREFDAGVVQVRDHGLAPSLFGVRVRSVLDERPRWANAAYLAGLLIGGEMVDLLAWKPVSSPIVLAASTRFSRPYGRALRTLEAGDRVVEVPPAELVGATVRAHALLVARCRTSRRLTPAP